MKISKSSSFILLALIVVSVVILSSLFFRNPHQIVVPIKFLKFELDDVVRSLTVLFLISLFYERAVELYVLTFRKLEEQSLEIELQQSKSTDELQASKSTEQIIKLNEYKDETRKIALWAALIGGILISIVGVRGLEPLTVLEGASNWQKCFFRLLDIFLTGALIAGGSDTIHRILQVFTTFMDTIAARNKIQSDILKTQTVVPTQSD